VSITDAVVFSVRCKALLKFFVTGFSSPIFADSRMSKLQETGEFEPDLPKRFFNAFKMKDPIDGAPSTAAIPNIFHRNSASKDSNSQVGMWCCVTCTVFTLSWCGLTRVIFLPFLIPKGTAMQMLTGQRVALGALVVGLESILFLTFSSRQTLTLFNHLPGCRLVLYIRLGMS